MGTKLIYWPHSRSGITKEEIIAASQLRMHPWPKDWPLPLSEGEAEERARKINELADKPSLYTEEQFGKLEEKPDLKECYEFFLGRHFVSEPIPTFHGFTPRFCFHDSGFKTETKIDLLEDLVGCAETKSSLRRTAPTLIPATYLGKGGRLAGRDEALESKKRELEQVLNRLNEGGVDSIVFRSYRRFPWWDKVHVYSQGNFKI